METESIDNDPLSARLELDLKLDLNAQDTHRQLHPVDRHPLEDGSSSANSTQSMDNNSQPLNGTNDTGHKDGDDGGCSRTRSKPSSPVNEAILSGDVFSNWIHCICVVTFDIELGQAIEVL